jgi:hypothetical protein
MLNSGGRGKKKNSPQNLRQVSDRRETKSQSAAAVGMTRPTLEKARAMLTSRDRQTTVETSCFESVKGAVRNLIGADERKCGIVVSVDLLQALRWPERETRSPTLEMRALLSIGNVGAISWDRGLPDRTVCVEFWEPEP